MELVKYEQARKSLEAASTVDEVKDIINKSARLAEYAKRAKDTQLEFYAAEIRVRAERKAGEMLEVGGPKHGGDRKSESRSNVTTLKDLDISRDESSQWQRLAAVPEDVFESKVQQAKESEEPLSLRKFLKKKEVIKFSGEYEWYTPPEYTELVKKVMGGIDLDPASTPKANKYVGANQIYTKQQDGLSQKWVGNIYCNPPYCMPDIECFVNRIIVEMGFNTIKQAILLTNSSTDTNWWQDAARNSLICFPNKRISFIGEDGKTRSQPLRGQSFFYFGVNERKFISVFSALGIVVNAKT